MNPFLSALPPSVGPWDCASGGNRVTFRRDADAASHGVRHILQKLRGPHHHVSFHVMHAHLATTSILWDPRPAKGPGQRQPVCGSDMQCLEADILANTRSPSLRVALRTPTSKQRPRPGPTSETNASRGLQRAPQMTLGSPRSQRRPRCRLLQLLGASLSCDPLMVGSSSSLVNVGLLVAKLLRPSRLWPGTTKQTHIASYAPFAILSHALERAETSPLRSHKFPRPGTSHPHDAFASCWLAALRH